MIGLSISFCVRDIARGKVAIGDVNKIVAGTKVADPDAWDELLARYKEIYWRGLDNAEDIFRQLLSEGKIEQPRLTNGDKAPYVGGGHWTDSEYAIIWSE